MLNVAMNQLGTVYATKRRRRNGKSLKPPPKDGPTKSNPSKRHRERLNGELDTLASLLPFEQNILSKLDRLSILRLAVSYLRTKSYFQVSMIREKDENGLEYRSRDLTAYDHTPLDGELFLQALNGFLLILTCDGEVFFATHSIESYLGFHQSDIVHQSVYELVHSEDREELQRQLMWNAFLPPEYSSGGGVSLQDAIHSPEHASVLERSFTVRFRCLLDNTSGFLRLDIRGRVKVLHGQNRKPTPSPEDPPLALFALCTPFGPPSLLEVPQKEVMFKSKHKLDLSLVSMDARGKLLLGYNDSELSTLGGYDLVHFDDLAYVCSAHQELLKTGASGLIAYRLQTKDSNAGAQQWQWLQTSSRLVYKNSKPDFIISTHRPLMEEEGRDLLGKRTMDFKVSYLDAGLTNSYFSDQDTMPLPSTPSSVVGSAVSVGSGSAGSAPAPKTRRYKTQLRDFLASCRTKRKVVPEDYTSSVAGAGATTVPVVVDPVGVGASPFAAAYSSAAAASPYANCYASPANYGVPENYQQNFYPNYENSTARYLTDSAAAASLFQYRTLGTYYPAAAEYSPAAYVGVGVGVGNGFLDVGRGCLYENQYGKESSSAANCQLSEFKSSSHGSSGGSYSTASSGHHQQSSKSSSKHIKLDPDAKHSHSRGSSDDYASMMHYANGNDTHTRQTVLMWGSSAAAAALRHNSVIQQQAAHSQSAAMYDKKYGSGSSSDPLRSLSDMNSTGSGGSTPSTSSGGSLSNHHGGSSDSKSHGLYLPSYASSMAHAQMEQASELFGARYLLSSYGGGDKSDRSPLLSISEVTNTLLNHNTD